MPDGTNVVALRILYAKETQGLYARLVSLRRELDAWSPRPARRSANLSRRTPTNALLADRNGYSRQANEELDRLRRLAADLDKDHQELDGFLNRIDTEIGNDWRRWDASQGSRPGYLIEWT